MEEKYGTDYLRTFLLFLITIILVGLEVASGKFSMIFLRIGKGIQLLGLIKAIGKNWDLLEKELQDLSEEEKRDLAKHGAKELGILDEKVALDLTYSAVSLAADLIDFVNTLKSTGKLSSIIK